MSSSGENKEATSDGPETSSDTLNGLAFPSLSCGAREGLHPEETKDGNALDAHAAPFSNSINGAIRLCTSEFRAHAALKMPLNVIRRCTK